MISYDYIILRRIKSTKVIKYLIKYDRAFKKKNGYGTVVWKWSDFSFVTPLWMGRREHFIGSFTYFCTLHCFQFLLFVLIFKFIMRINILLFIL